MSSTTPATLSNLLALKTSADYAADMVQSFFKKWLAVHRRLLLLKMCKRHAGQANLPLYIAAKALTSCWWKLLCECLATVVKVQRDMRSARKEMKEWTKKEIVLDKSYYDIAM
jgi:hypothetical protein